MSQSPHGILAFDEFTLDPSHRRLLRHGKEIPLTPRVFDLLLIFAQHSGELLRREELMDLLWGDRIVEESNLTQSVFLLRKALGDEARHYVVTVPGVGYRFQAPVRPAAADEFDGVQRVPKPPAHSSFPSRSIALWTAVVLGSLVLLYPAWRLAVSPEPSTLDSIESLAILPFVDLETHSISVLGLGIADLVFSELSQGTRLELPTLPIVLDYYRPGSPPADTGRDLGVEAVLNGTTVHSGSSVRATMQVVLSGSGRVLLSEAVEAPADHPRLLQNRVATALMEAFGSSESSHGLETAAARQRRLTPFEAYELALVGRYHLAKRSFEGLVAARDSFARALEVDPSFAEAWSDLADAEYLLGFYRYGEVPTAERYTRAEESAQRALDLSPSLVHPLAVLGMVALHRDFNPAEALTHFERAIEASPSSGRVHHWYAWALFSLGREGEGYEQLEIARRLQPLSLILRSAQAMAVYHEGRSERALELLDEILTIHPGFGRAHYNRALALEQLGRLTEAEEALSLAEEILGNTHEVQSALAHLYFVDGREEEGRRMLEELSADGASPAHVTIVLCAAGESEAALEMLHQAIELREVWVWSVRADPRLEPVRRLPAFRTVEEKLRLHGLAVETEPSESELMMP